MFTAEQQCTKIFLSEEEIVQQQNKNNTKKIIKRTMTSNYYFILSLFIILIVFISLPNHNDAFVFHHHIQPIRYYSRIQHHVVVLPLATSISTTTETKITTAPIHNHNNDNDTKDSFQKSMILFTRAREIGSIAFTTLLPLLMSGMTLKTTINATTSIDDDINNVNDDIWEQFWSIQSTKNNNQKGMITNAHRVVQALQQLGPTYVKFGQALASRPDIIPKSLAAALCTLQDDMDPFDTNIAKEIIKNELLLMNRTDYIDDDDDSSDEEHDIVVSTDDIQRLIDSLSNEPVAAASVGQVYKGYLPNYGPVAVKVQRPGIKDLVEKDFSLLRSLASLVESIPSFDLNVSGNYEKDVMTNGRLINTELVAAVDEFMSRIFEELDYRNEAKNAKTFAKLYCKKVGSSVKSLPNGEGVIVPEIISSICTKNVLVMEWIEGSKLTTISPNNDEEATIINREETTCNNNELELQENLALIEQALYVTLSQLLDTGVMHADPHGGNLLKVSNMESTLKSPKSKSLSKLAYLDFGLLATIPESVRDGLVCAVASLVFAKDVEAVASLFGELDLLPQEVISDPIERKALTEALTKTMEEVLKYPQGESLFSTPTSSDSNTGQKIPNSRKIKTTVPTLEFDKLLDGLTRLVPRFKFRLPPYFINNARALGTLEGIARSLDPDFNCLKLMYPYALYRLLQNPTGSPVVESTLQSLIRSSETGRVDREKVAKLLRDTAMFTGYSRRKVLMDILKTKGGKRLVVHSLASEINHAVIRRIKYRFEGILDRVGRTSYLKL